VRWLLPHHPLLFWSPNRNTNEGKTYIRVNIRADPVVTVVPGEGFVKKKFAFIGEKEKTTRNIYVSRKWHGPWKRW
jgi:hypothetical protein